MHAQILSPNTPFQSCRTTRYGARGTDGDVSAALLEKWYNNKICNHKKTPRRIASAGRRIPPAPAGLHVGKDSDQDQAPVSPPSVKLGNSVAFQPADESRALDNPANPKSQSVLQTESILRIALKRVHRVVARSWGYVWTIPCCAIGASRRKCQQINALRPAVGE